jgi:signal transduction histidine kinase
MRFRTWPVAAMGLVGLLGLIVLFGVTTSRKADDIYTRLEVLNAHHRKVEAVLRRLRSDVHLSGIFVRDYLLDTVRARDPEYRARLGQFRASSMDALEDLTELVADSSAEQASAASLRTNLESYWQAFEPLFYWTATDKLTQSANFVKREVLPRREAAMSIALEIEQLNNANLNAESQEVTRQYAAYRAEMQRLLWQSLLLGILVAVVAVNRLRVLERRSDEQRVLAEAAEARMRALSQQVVATQEEERKQLSRELHDHVGQMLTGLRMELGRIERVGAQGNAAVAQALADGRSLVDNIMRTVRDLALGLRPSMLDDFGLQPALAWHVREFSRRSNMAATFTATGSFDDLPDPYRTCIYRSVQEALTNCARHSGASRVEVDVQADAAGLSVTVKDNGVGIPSQRKAVGLGLRGMEERVKELSGTLTIDTGFGAGTTVRFWLPLPASRGEVLDARRAG